MNKNAKILFLIFFINVLSNSISNSELFTNREYQKIAVFKNDSGIQYSQCEKSPNSALFNFIWDIQLILGYTISISEKLSTHRPDVFSKDQCSTFEKESQECMIQLSILKKDFSAAEVAIPKIENLEELEEDVRKLERYEIIRLFSKLIVKTSKALPNRYRYRDHHARRLLNIITAVQEEMQNITESLRFKKLDHFIQSSNNFTDKMLSINHLIK